MRFIRCVFLVLLAFQFTGCDSSDDVNEMDGEEIVAGDENTDEGNATGEDNANGEDNTGGGDNTGGDGTVDGDDNAGGEDNTEDNEEVEQNLQDAEALLALVNESREAEGLSRLVLNSILNKTALSHSKDMETNDYFNHISQDGRTFGERAKGEGYAGAPIGENIAKGQRTVEAVHNSWMNSDGHRRNILNENATEMGLGHSGVYWTQIFGR